MHTLVPQFSEFQSHLPSKLRHYQNSLAIEIGRDVK